MAESSIKCVEKTAGKGEIPHHEQFSFSHSVFKTLILQTRKNQGLFGKGLKSVMIKWNKIVKRFN